jgi:hypothetical protein
MGEMEKDDECSIIDQKVGGFWWKPRPLWPGGAVLSCRFCASALASEVPRLRSGIIAYGSHARIRLNFSAGGWPKITRALNGSIPAMVAVGQDFRCAWRMRK